jgi:acetyltransferase-like isoleucine patch superfamily enzyme
MLSQLINYLVYSYWKSIIGSKRIKTYSSSTISILSKLRLVNGGSIEIGKYSHIHDYAMILTYGGKVKIGKYFSLNPFSIIYGHGGVRIGDNVRIAAHTVMAAANHIFKDKNIPIRDQGLITQGIIINDDVWVGANCTILDGVEIGKGCVIGAGAVVNKSLPPFSIAVGNPARVISQRGSKK